MSMRSGLYAWPSATLGATTTSAKPSMPSRRVDFSGIPLEIGCIESFSRNLFAYNYNIYILYNIYVYMYIYNIIIYI